MSTAIIYRSFFGTTRKYAESLREEIDADIYKHSQIDEHALLKYDPIILCAGTYAGWISLRGFLKKYWDALEDRHIVLLVIGAAPADDPWSVRAYEKIPELIRGGMKYFKLPATLKSAEAGKAMKENLAPVVKYIKSVS